MNSVPRIHVLLPVHNRRVTTEKFIRCLVAQTYRNWHLILIDDGSKDDTESMARALAASITVLRGKGDWWWAGGLQQGFDWLKQAGIHHDDLVLTINDDTEFDPVFLEKAVKAVKPRSLLLAQQYNIRGEFLEAGVHWDWRTLSAVAVPNSEGLNCLSTRGLFMRVGDFMEIGGFHPVLLPHYLSDYEFTLRASKKGFALISDPEVFLRYDESLTGMHGIEGLSVFGAWKRLFSIKSSSNPFYWTSFILLACPPRYIPVNVMRSWWAFSHPVTTRIRNVVIRIRKLLGPHKRAVFAFLGIPTKAQRLEKKRTTISHDV